MDEIDRYFIEYFEKQEDKIKIKFDKKILEKNNNMKKVKNKKIEIIFQNKLEYFIIM